MSRRVWEQGASPRLAQSMKKCIKQSTGIQGTTTLPSLATLNNSSQVSESRLRNALLNPGASNLLESLRQWPGPTDDHQ